MAQGADGLLFFLPLPAGTPDRFIFWGWAGGFLWGPPTDSFFFTLFGFAGTPDRLGCRHGLGAAGAPRGGCGGMASSSGAGGWHCWGGAYGLGGGGSGCLGPWGGWGFPCWGGGVPAAFGRLPSSFVGRTRQPAARPPPNSPSKETPSLSPQSPKQPA